MGGRPLHWRDRVRGRNDHHGRVVPLRRSVQPKALVLADAEREEHSEDDEHEDVVEHGFDDVPDGNIPIVSEIKFIDKIDEPVVDESGHVDKVADKIKDGAYQEEDGALWEEAATDRQ